MYRDGVQGTAPGKQAAAATYLMERDLPSGRAENELVIDVSHKALYSFVTGALSDALVRPARGSSAERRALGRRRKGHA